MDRRTFLAASMGGLTTLAGTPGVFAADKPKLKKAVKFGMVNIKGSTLQKFELLAKLGFQGVEVDSPSNLNLEEALKASKATGVKIHGVVDSAHWKDTLSSPDAEMRGRGLAALKTALDDAKFLGADTALLVPGVVKEGATYEECWERSMAEVKKALPHAEKTGVKIAIETVWNNFITKPEQLIEYVDAFQSPLVGAYFDISNMLKYGVPAAEWIRKLGKRMLKFDFKGYSITKAKAEKNEWAGFKVEIGEGDENWPEVLKACGEVGYDTWATAEVAGGGEERLRFLSEKMDELLELTPKKK